MLRRALLTLQAHMRDVPQFLKDATNVKSFVMTALQERPNSVQLRDCLDRVHGILEFARSLHTEVLSAEFHTREASFMFSLASEFRFFDVPSDGNCFFSALTTALLGEEGSVSEAVDGFSAATASNAAALRAATADYLRRHGARYCSAVRESVGEGRSVVDEADDDVIEVYAAVLETPGVFADRLDIQFVSDMLHIDINMYYLTDPRTSNPAETFRPCGGVGDMAVSIFHSITGRHFQAMVPH
jgi:hypothetical protein